MRMAPPVEIEARRVLGSLDGDDGAELVGMVERQLQGDIAAKARAHENGAVELERVAERDDEVHVVAGGQRILFLPPLAIERRIGLSVPGQIIGDHVVAVGDGLVLEQAAPLMIVATGRVLAHQRYALAVAQVEDLVFVAVHINGDVTTDNGRVLGHSGYSCN